jgi:putative tricarboxylic transport membrane protein
VSSDFWSGLALGALGAYIVATASGWEYLGAEGPGPGFFPLWYGIAMLALAIMLVITNVRKKTTAENPLDWSEIRRALGAWLALAASLAALKLVGFVVAFAALTFFIVAVMYRRPLRVAATVALATTAGFYLLFPLALGVPLP